MSGFVERVLNAPPAVFRRDLDQLLEYLARKVIRERPGSSQPGIGEAGRRLPGRRYPRSPAERRKLQVERAERERKRFRIPQPSRTPVVRRETG